MTTTNSTFLWARFDDGRPATPPVLEVGTNLLEMPDFRQLFDVLCGEHQKSPDGFTCNVRIRNFPAIAIEWQRLCPTAGVADIRYQVNDDEMGDTLFVAAGKDDASESNAFAMFIAIVRKRGHPTAEVEGAVAIPRPVLISCHAGATARAHPSFEVTTMLGLMFFTRMALN